jgi:hypothetical protein
MHISSSNFPYTPICAPGGDLACLRVSNLQKGIYIREQKPVPSKYEYLYHPNQKAQNEHLQRNSHRKYAAFVWYDIYDTDKE